MSAPAAARVRALASPCALALGLLAAAPVAAAASGFEARCAEAAGGAGARVVSVGTERDGWRIDNSLSYRTLTRMKRPRVTHGYVLGLTHTESHVTVKVDGALLQDPQTQRECVLPRVTVTLAYQPIVVYIGREFAPGTCAYRELLAHEMRHLESYQAALPEVEARVRDRLGARVRARRVVVARAGQARALLQREIDGTWLPAIRAEMQAIERAQAAIDSPQEYARLSKVCQGEVQSFIGSTRHSRS